MDSISQSNERIRYKLCVEMCPWLCIMAEMWLQVWGNGKQRCTHTHTHIHTHIFLLHLQRERKTHWVVPCLCDLLCACVCVWPDMAPVITELDPDDLRGLKRENQSICTLEATVITGLEDVIWMNEWRNNGLLFVYYYLFNSLFINE